MKSRFIISIFLSLFALNSKIIAQTFHFEIKFTEKDTLAFDTVPKLNYLSPLAISRKSKFKIPIEISDFSVRKIYLDSIATQGKILSVSKWLNTAIIGVADSSVINILRNMSFVSTTRYIGKNNLQLAKIQQKLETAIDYGLSENGIKQMNGDYLHSQGYTGHDILIAVIDAGFINTNFMNDFAHLYSNGNIVAVKNFVLNNENVYSMDNHGTNVLSVLSAYNDGNIYGSAIDANYLLLLTEDSRQENIIEEYYWIQAAEFADSCGTDIISSSLGYNTFNSSEFNYSYNDFGQNSTIISQAANIASNKGILIITSAGNEGENSWKHITFPADNEQCLTVGSVDINGNKTSFSSTGINTLSYYKPNIVALGTAVNVSSSNNNYTPANGTSFSCPIVAGLAACLWEALPNKNASEIKKIIEESSSLYLNPNYDLGFGIPNFKLAMQTHHAQNVRNENLDIHPNPIKQGQLFTINSDEIILSIKIVDIQGKDIQIIYPDKNIVSISSNLLEKSCYFIIIESTNQIQVQKIVVN